MWRNRTLNRATDLWYTVFQGHPGFVFDLCHNNNHHRYCNTRNDWTRTYRHRDDNSLWGLTIHPVESALTLAPVVRGHLRALRQYDQVRYRGALAAYGWLFAWIGCALAIDWQKALLYVLVPQLFALYWLLGANYLQHAHTNELERFAASRNFLGLINPLCFNIGLHTAHHMQGTLHWSKLPQLHDQIRPQIHPALIEPSLLWYGCRSRTDRSVKSPYRKDDNVVGRYDRLGIGL